MFHIIYYIIYFFFFPLFCSFLLQIQTSAWYSLQTGWLNVRRSWWRGAPARGRRPTNSYDWLETGKKTQWNTEKYWITSHVCAILNGKSSDSSQYHDKTRHYQHANNLLSVWRSWKYREIHGIVQRIHAIVRGSSWWNLTTETPIWEENLVEPSFLHVSNFNVILLSSIASSHSLLYWKSTMRHLFILNGGGEDGGRTRTKESQNSKCIWNFQAKYKVF